MTAWKHSCGYTVAERPDIPTCPNCGKPIVTWLTRLLRYILIAMVPVAVVGGLSTYEMMSVKQPTASRPAAAEQPPPSGLLALEDRAARKSMPTALPSPRSEPHGTMAVAVVVRQTEVGPVLTSIIKAGEPRRLQPPINLAACAASISRDGGAGRAELSDVLFCGHNPRAGKCAESSNSPVHFLDIGRGILLIPQRDLLTLERACPELSQVE